MKETKSSYILRTPRYMSTKRKHKIIIKLVFVLFISITVGFVSEQRIMPILFEISKVEAKQIANTTIDECVKLSIDGKNLKTGDFFSSTENAGTISANTILINELCMATSENINKKMIAINNRKIYVPLGVATGIEIFANGGPEIGFTIRQMGQADVGYATEFSSAGINQTNYKVYLTVKMDIKMINPIRSEVVETKRKVMLIDTIIEGKVPNNYLNLK